MDTWILKEELMMKILYIEPVVSDIVDEWKTYLD